MTLQEYFPERTAVKLVDGVESAVRDGFWSPGDRLPTVRALAGELDVSPATVESAYRRLRERGVIVGERRRGTRVAPKPSSLMPASSVPPDGLRDLATGNPDPKLLPPIEDAIRSIDKTPRLYTDELFDDRLLEIAREQFQADAVPCEHLAVVSGAMDGIERVLRARLRVGDRVLVEDPGFPGVFDQLTALGLALEPVRIDQDGPLPDDLRRGLSTKPKALVVTPRAQNPTGAALTESRAAELRGIIQDAPQLLVVEDDHAGPIAGLPAQSLCTDREGPWAHIRSVSKSLGPDLRLAVVSGDEETMRDVRARQLVGMRWVSHILQRIVVELWSNAEVLAKLRKAERTYAKRRQRLIGLLAEHEVRAEGKTGLNVWLPVIEEARVVRELAAKGWGVTAGERFRFASDPAVRITVANLKKEETLQLADDIARCGVASRRAGLA